MGNRTGKSASSTPHCEVPPCILSLSKITGAFLLSQKYLCKFLHLNAHPSIELNRNQTQDIGSNLFDLYFLISVQIKQRRASKRLGVSRSTFGKSISSIAVIVSLVDKLPPEELFKTGSITIFCETSLKYLLTICTASTLGASRF